MKVIVIKTCGECPYIHHNSGMGYTNSFVRCDKFGIMLLDWGGDEDFNFHKKIHPECKLRDY